LRAGDFTFGTLIISHLLLCYFLFFQFYIILCFRLWVVLI